MLGRPPFHRLKFATEYTLDLVPLPCWVRIPSEAGRGFRREGGHPSDVKAATHSEAKAATYSDVKAATF